jgi:hypothetical protein
MALPNHQHTLQMGTEVVPETSAKPSDLEAAVCPKKKLLDSVAAKALKLITHRHGYNNQSTFYRETIYEGESNENLKHAVKIRNTARLSCKLTIVILMV